MKERVGNLAQTNYYYVNMSLSSALKEHFKKSYIGDATILTIENFITKLGYLCSEASLPTTSYATSEVKDNFIGITQEFAHTRLYTDLDLTFYVDADYQVLRFFEGWMDYISGGNSPQQGEPAAGSSRDHNIYRRFNYPNDYKLDTLQIMKFERDYRKVLEYTFVNAFPKSLATVPVSYGSADILKVTVTFNYDRYVVQRTDLYQEESKEESKVQNPQPGQPSSISQPPLVEKRQTIDQMVSELQSMQEASRLRQAGYSPGLGQSGRMGPGF
jgi:hypothetical protein